MSAKTLYLDSAAAMPVSENALDNLRSFRREFYANQESVHAAGQRSRHSLNASAAAVTENLGGGMKSPKTFWASCGTDAIVPFFEHGEFPDGDIVTTAAEHPAWRAAVERLAARDSRAVHEVELLRTGLVDLDDLRSVLSSAPTAIIAIHHVNSIIGAKQDLTAIARLAGKLAPNACFAVDSIQSAGKIPVEGVADAVFFSGHKFGAPTGGGLVFDGAANFGKNLDTLRRRYLKGRMEPAMAATMAAEIKRERNDFEHIIALNKMTRERLLRLAVETGIEIIIPVPEDRSSPYILCAVIPGFQGAVVVRMLSEHGIMVSAGSACQAEAGGPARELKAMGFDDNSAYGVVRISFWADNNSRDIDRLIDAMRGIFRNY